MRSLSSIRDERLYSYQKGAKSIIVCRCQDIRHLSPVVLTKKQKCNRRVRNQMNKQLNLLSKTVLWIFPVINGFLMPAEFYISALTMTCLGLRNAFVRPNFSAFEG